MTDFVEAESTRFSLGYSLIIVVLINIAYHILSMLWMIYKTVVKPLYFKVKRKLCHIEKGNNLEKEKYDSDTKRLKTEK